MSDIAYVTEPELPTKVFDDWDFTLLGGLLVPMSLDTAAGDTIEFGKDIITVRYVPKPSLTNPDITVPEEVTTLYKSNILVMQHRKREVATLTNEQQRQVTEFLRNPFSPAVN